MLESPEMFGSLPLDPNNEWIKLSKLVPWREFDLRYAENFRSKKGQRATDSRMALGALLIKPAYNIFFKKPFVRLFLRLNHEINFVKGDLRLFQKV